MRVVLGLDAAWTETQPSGVALAVEVEGHWSLAAVAPSYGRFMALADPSPLVEPRPAGSSPDPLRLLQTAEAVGGRPVDLVAVDMPMARTPIVGRRAADNAVSRAYGGRKGSTHTPSAIRPGRISDELRGGFEQAGYGLCTEAIVTPGLIEVYPHPALIELARSAERLPYKVAKAGRYWRDVRPSERRERLLDQWRLIVGLLDREMAGVSDALPPLGASSSGVELKAYEDMIDAVVCAWTGVIALDGGAVRYGDADTAIWIPTPRAASGV